MSNHVSANKEDVERLRAAVESAVPQLIDELKGLVRIASISSQSAHADDVQASADSVAALVRGAGVSDVSISAVEGGLPAVIARIPAPEGAPTVLLYAHHDVQPAGDLADWTGDPFEPIERDGRLFGRGAADDKAGFAAHLGVLRILGDRLGVGVTLLIEGEEEIGSFTIDAFLDAHAEELRADVIVIADSGNWTIDTPTFTTTLRGLVDCVVDVTVLEHAQHSGVYGGAVPDALTALCRLLATLHDENGDVAIAGLIRAATPGIDMSEDQLRAEAGVLEGVELIGTGTVTERIWASPAVTVIAIDAPAISAAANVLLPRAQAMVSLRIPPGQDPAAAAEALATHLTSHAPWGARVTVTPGRLANATQLTPSGPAYEVAKQAFEDAWDGAESVHQGIGGSIPLIAQFAVRYPDATVLVVGPGDPASRWHGPDESLDLGLFARLVVAECLLIERLGNPDA